MSYTTQDQLIDLFGADAFDGVTDELWEQVLAGVDGVIDGKLAARYSVPVSPVPAVLARIAGDLARYQFNLIYDEIKDDGLKTRYDYALAQLQEIADGKLALIGATAAQPSVSIGAPSYSAPTRVFDAATLSGF